MLSLPGGLLEELHRIVLDRTHRRVNNLKIELSPDQVILQGDTTSYHAKQLAQEGILDKLPGIRLRNAITVYR